MCKGGCKLIFLLATGILFSCGSKNSEKKFFDVPGYFRSEIKYIKANFSTVQKRSIYNGDSTRKEFKVMDMNWEKEFGLFLECDINKPIYYANMKIGNSSYDGATIYSTLYTNKSEKYPIRGVKIDFCKPAEGDDYPISVQINSQRSNLINATQLTAFYKKGERYFIEGTQRIKQLGDENHFFIEGKFK
jgi:hypothetical protein